MTRARPRPVLIFGAILAGLIFLLVIRLFYLQILQGSRFSQLARLNHIRIISEQAPRGVILDRFGKILATSEPIFSAFIYPTGQETEEDLAKISQILKIPASEISQNLKEKNSGFISSVLLKERLSSQELFRLEEEKYRFPNLIIQNWAKRNYPEKRTLAHVLGYVGLISPEDLEKFSGVRSYSPQDFIGKAGLEFFYEEWLKGKNGGQQIAVDVAGRPINILESIPPIAGQDLKLTIDLELQKAAEAALGANAGSVVILDVKTGEVLALVSHPNFDPNIFTSPISSAYWQSQKRRGYPFFNRAINGYPPGSVFKIITAMAGLENKILSPSDSYFCPGYFKLGPRQAACWKKDGHGWVNLKRAIVNSCDVAFYNIGLKVGLERITDYARKFGFGSKTKIELPWETKGFLPTARWKEEKLHERWYDGDTINLAIGQGFVQASPLQVALFMEALANDGVYYLPEIVEKENLKTNRKNFLKRKILGKIILSMETWRFIKESMREAVRSGTGKAAYLKEVEIAGKTGTAEDPPRYRPHAWFAGWAPYENPQLAIAVFVEQGGHGGEVAAPIAREIVKWWSENRKSVPEESESKVNF